MEISNNPISISQSKYWSLKQTSNFEIEEKDPLNIEISDGEIPSKAEDRSRKINYDPFIYGMEAEDTTNTSTGEESLKSLSKASFKDLLF